jgi:hypothetical protein
MLHYKDLIPLNDIYLVLQTTLSKHRMLNTLPFLALTSSLHFTEIEILCHSSQLSSPPYFRNVYTEQKLRYNK